jgi:hypothetical protein
MAVNLQYSSLRGQIHYAVTKFGQAPTAVMARRASVAPTQHAAHPTTTLDAP